jgi:DNA-binding PadR family transcriptional regulator
MASVDRKLLTREILLGFWKVHILHHAAEHPVVGQWVLSELRRHGYDISPGTLYPLLKRMERAGWLRCEPEPGGGPRGRRYYHLTAAGAAVLDVVRETVVELHHEVVEEASEHHHYPPLRLAPRSSETTSGTQKSTKARTTTRTAGASRGRRRPRR